jgi:ABC-2 type transport system permease protein
VIALILGIVAMTGECRHKTITDTFLTAAKRLRLVAAKAAVQAVMGVALAAIRIATGVPVALALLPTKTHPPVDWALIAEISIGVVVAYALHAVLGVAVGALINNQIAAIIVGLF